QAVGHKLTLICAPPGYGKTTLAAHYAARVDVPVAWHAIGERQRDVPNLHTQALAALAYAVPGIQDLEVGFAYTPGEMGAEVADFLRDTLTHDILYVLDDVQLLQGSPAAEAWLSALVERAPATCHILIVSRTLPDLPLTEMIARGEVLAIGQEELRFSAEEVTDLAGTVLARTIEPDDAARLTERLEGWPAGTILALQPLPTELAQTLFREDIGQPGTGPEALFYTLAASMLAAQPPGLRDFLLASSVLERFTPELCRTVLQIPNSAYWMAEALNRNLFLSRGPGGLTYHKLFRQFLQQKLKDDRAAWFAELHTRAASWLLENDDLDEAFDHFWLAGLNDEAVGIAERVARAYFAQGKAETLLHWGHRLRQVQAPVPRLMFACAMIHTDRGDYDPAAAELAEAEVAFAARGDTAGLREVRLQRAMIALQRSEYSVVQRLAGPLAALAQRTGSRDDPVPADDPTNVAGRALKVLGVMALRQGDVRGAIERLITAVPLHRANGDAYALANALQDLGVAYWRLGDLEEASAHLQEVVALRRQLGSASALALALNNLGFLYHLSGHYRQALETLETGLSVSNRVPHRRTEAYLLASLGDLQRDRGAYDEALHLYDKALEVVGHTEPALRAAILTGSSTLWRWRGNLDEAINLADEALTLAEGHSIVMESAMARAALWAARLEQGSVAPAANELRAVVAEMEPQGTPIELVWAHGLVALAALAREDRQAARQSLVAALGVAEAVGSAQPLVAEMTHTPALRSFVGSNPSLEDVLAPELGRLQAFQINETPPLPVQSRLPVAMPYSLRVLALGQERIERDGDALGASQWQSTAARSLFIYVLFNGPASRDTLSLTFWADHTPQRVRSNFHTTLWRARQALGDNVLVFHDDHYQINPDLVLWCDALAFEQLVRQARPLSPRDARTEDLWRKAVELYHGDFLPSLDDDWAFYRRTTLQEYYLEALVGLGECARARGDFRAAVGLFKRGLHVDPYREDIYRAIFSCYSALGERHQVLTHLQKLEGVLRDELAITPSPETVALARTLLA
ncbi:MAG: tetratricopeptide repeat protein, partial [Anaerolineae bacterium]|nr:tetratricopeptide repeat protein [Anaerolineae bacterium]